jgi:hypothetical protein
MCLSTLELEVECLEYWSCLEERQVIVLIGCVDLVYCGDVDGRKCTSSYAYLSLVEVLVLRQQVAIYCSLVYSLQ